MTWKRLVRIILFWPSVHLIRGGVFLVSFAETPVGRLSIRPLFRFICRYVLHARPIRFLRDKSPAVVPTDTISTLIEGQKMMAVIPCSCRAGRPHCVHRLHGPHELDVCLTVGFGALLQIGSGLGKRIDIEEARALFKRAARSGLVHHAIYSMGRLLEICSCCSETCAAILAYKDGIPEALRPSDFVAIRGADCTACSGTGERICETICPYGAGPSHSGCLGCGSCARYCPQHAVAMIPRIGMPATAEEAAA